VSVRGWKTGFAFFPIAGSAIAWGGGTGKTHGCLSMNNEWTESEWFKKWLELAKEH
jgi:hypothetical protein